MTDRISWLTVVWSMNASACLSLALIHFFIWWRQRQKYAHVLFSIASIAVAGIAACELMMMRSRTVNEFAAAMRLAHIPIFITIVAIVGYVHIYFGTGRTWLFAIIVVLRLLSLCVNFLAEVNLNYISLSRLRQLVMFWGETAAVGEGVVSQWAWLGQVASLLFVAFVIDTSIALWRRGNATERRRALLVGGSITFFSFVAVFQAILVNQGLLHMPYLISPPFFIPILVMAYELSTQVVQSAILGEELSSSRADLKELEQRISLAADAAELGFWEWDIPDDNIWMSARTRELLGLSSQERVSLDRFLSQVRDEDRERVRIAIERSVREGVDYQIEYRVKTDNGPRWIAASGKPAGVGARNSQRLRGVAMDITKRRAMEHDLSRQRHQLAHLSRVTMLGELSGSLAHELNQPLTAILSNAQAALRFLKQDSAQLHDVREILDDIITADKRAGEIIRRLRLLFKKGEIEEQCVDLNALIQEVLHFLNSDLINHMVVVKTQLASNLPQVRGDRVQFQQVLINIIMNGCEAMSAESRESRILSLSTARMEGDLVQITIADTGVGIPADEMEHIFEPFVSTKVHGMGMGLAVCRTIVTAHGGRLWATDNAPRGAVFHLTLPAVMVETA